MAITLAGLRPENIESLLNKYTYFQIVVYNTFWIKRISMISILVFIICLIRISSMSLAALYNEISFGQSASTSEMNQLIMKWRKSYILIRDLVAEMNAFFGQPIIIVVLTTMLSSINLTFTAIVKIKINDFSFLYQYILEIVTNIICLGLLAFIAEEIPQQVK